jgi:ethanolamine transporter
MNVNGIIMCVMVAAMTFGALDKYAFKGRFGYGAKFDEAFDLMGPLALAIVGIMCLAPVLGKVLTPLGSPLFHLIGADPAMLAGSILASDMGGFYLASTMTADPQIQVLSGIFLGSMMGVAVIFVIPYTATVMDESDRPYLGKGIVAGLIPIPLGCLVSGILGGIPMAKLLVNLAPVTALALLLAIVLWFFPGPLIRIFQAFSQLITWIIGAGLVAAIVEALTGFVVIPGMAPIAAQFEIVGLIVITLAGAYPLMHFIIKAFTRPLGKAGGMLGINDVAVSGMLACLASSFPMYAIFKDMDNKGKVIAMAFSIGAGFALGDILGYTSAVAPAYIFPMIAGKLTAGALAAAIAWLALKRDGASRGSA